MILTPSFVKSRTKIGRVTDSHRFGLALSVKKRRGGGVSKSWLQKIRVAGRWTNKGLGPCSRVSLRKARRIAAGNYLAVRNGSDPFPKPEPKIPTFREVTLETIDMRRSAWTTPRTERQWVNAFENHVYKRLGKVRVDAISAADVIDTLQPVGTTRPATGKMLLRYMRQVFDVAIARDYRPDNPAAKAAGVLNFTAKVKHQKALASHASLAVALAKVRECSKWAGAKLAIEFLLLTAMRSIETRGAKWSEFDLESKTWTVPADRMKGRREHRVPLSRQALAVLERARALTLTASGLVFPSVRGKVMSDVVPSRLLRDLGIGSTVHGFRSSFRDWAAETGVSREVAEQALSHAVGSRTEAAYFRTDLLEQRREVMQSWGDYVAPD